MLYVAAAVAASILTNLGLALQARDAHREADRPGMSLELVATLARHPTWLAGLGMALLSSVLQIFALTRLPIAFVQPTVAAGIVLVPLATARAQKVRFTPSLMMAVVALAGGVSILAITLPPQRATIHGSLWVLLAISTALVAGGSLLARVLDAPGIAFAVITGLCFASSGLLAKFVATVPFAGLEFWMAAMAMTAFAVTGVVSESSALQRTTATIAAPIILVVATVTPVVAARAFFEERWNSPLLTAIVIGLVVITAARIAHAAKPTPAPMDAG